MRIARLTLVLMCAVLCVLGYFAGAEAPWDLVVESVFTSAQGPFARVLAVVAIIVAGVLLALGNINGGLRKVTQVIYGLGLSALQWLIGDAVGDDGSEREPARNLPMQVDHSHSSAMPPAPGSYQLALKATPAAGLMSASWGYPGALVERRTERYPALRRLKARYEIVTDSEPRWKPLRVLDDGEQVYIHFPEKALDYRMPQLFVSDACARQAPTMYQMQGSVGVVNHLFTAAELRTFGPRGCVVRILHRDATPCALPAFADFVA